MSTKKVSNEKTNWLLIALIVIFASILWVLIFQDKPVINSLVSKLAVSSATTKPSNPTEQTLYPTADWKTYVSGVFGFSLRYPTYVRVTNEINDQYNKSIVFKGEKLSFHVMLRENPGTIVLDKYYYMDSPIKQKTTLGGNSANVYESPLNGYCDGGGGCSEPAVTIVTEKGSYLYHVGFVGDTQLSDVESLILSTFKFTN